MANASTVAGSAVGIAGTGSSSLNSSKGIQIVDNDTLYIADTGNNRVVVIQTRLHQCDQHSWLTWQCVQSTELADGRLRHRRVHLHP